MVFRNCLDSRQALNAAYFLHAILKQVYSATDLPLLAGDIDRNFEIVQRS